MRGLSLLILMVGVVVLAGCASGRPKSDTYRDRSGVVRVIEDNREICVRSCNEDYDRCAESDAAQRETVGATRGVFGASVNCTRDLSSCLSTCKGL